MQVTKFNLVTDLQIMLSNVTHSNFYFECNTERGSIDQLYIELGSSLLPSPFLDRPIGSNIQGSLQHMVLCHVVHDNAWNYLTAREAISFDSDDWLTSQKPSRSNIIPARDCEVAMLIGPNRQIDQAKPIAHATRRGSTGLHGPTRTRHANKTIAILHNKD